jgi:hypothetical protein
MTPAQMQLILIMYKHPKTVGEAIRLINKGKYLYGRLFDELA